MGIRRWCFRVGPARWTPRGIPVGFRNGWRAGPAGPPHSGDSANGAASAPAAAYMAAHAARPAAWCEGIAAKALEAAYLVRTWAFENTGAGSKKTIAEGGEHAEHVAKNKERHTIANDLRKGKLARDIARIVDKNLPVDDEIEERRQKQIAAVAYEYFKGFVASLRRDQPAIEVAIGVQQARSWGQGPYYEAQTLDFRKNVSWRKELPPNMFLVRCWDVYNTTYTPNSASVEWQIQEERSTYGG
ncbi:hypothetical protein NFJ02_10g02540 [Pycnococcus provasolii]